MAVEVDPSRRTAIVTGAGSGIGRETALRLGQSGATVVAAYLARPGAEQTVQALVEGGGQGLALEFDVRDSLRAGVAATVERFGTVDILLNSAAGGTVKLFEDQTRADVSGGSTMAD